MFSSHSHQLVLGLLFALSSLPSTQAQARDGPASSVFITPSRDLGFALTVPEDSNDDLFFTMQMPSAVTWGAIGLGSQTMNGALVLMMYADSTGENVTMSPRLSYDTTEPVYAPNIDIETLPGTGLINDTTYIFNGRCGNCRTWDIGSIDVRSEQQHMIYATGEIGWLRTDDVQYSLRRHSSYGDFTMDMVRATGPGQVPIITPSPNVTLSGTAQGLSEVGDKDVVAMLHAVLMVLCFVGLFPFGVLIIRLGTWVRWHWINNSIALLFFVLGSGLGFKISTSYNRSKKFNTAHQVIGILLLIFVLVQFLLGFFHHRIFKKTQQPTKMAPIHVWLGRLVIVGGVANCFTGFPLALSPKYNYAVLGLVLVIFPAIALVLFTNNFLRRRWRASQDKSDGVEGYDMEPWRNANPATKHGVAR